MDYYDVDSLRLLAGGHHAERVREADAERLGRELRGRPQRRPRLRVTLGFSLTPRERAARPRLEA